MPTCPNCGNIVMNGDPYCSHCGTTFRWTIDSDDFENNNAFPDDTDRLLKKALIDGFNNPKNMDLVYLKIGNDDLDNGDYLHAYSAFKNCIEFNPKQDLAWAFLGIALIELGDIDDAKYCFSQSLKINPNNKYANDGLKDIHHNNLKNDTKLIEVYKKDFKSFLNTLSKNSNMGNYVSLDEKMKNLKKLYSHIDHNVSIERTVKFKLCETCGKKVNTTAKKCPYCNGTSFSDDVSKYEDTLRLKIESVKYCPICNEKYYESNFCINCGEKLITPIEYEDLIEKQKQKEIESLKNKKYCPFCSEERNFEDIFCNDCGEKLISGLDYDYIIKKREKLENDPHFIQKIKELKDSPKQNKLKKQSEVKLCPVCRQEISKSAAVCVYCRTKLKEY